MDDVMLHHQDPRRVDDDLPSAAAAVAVVAVATVSAYVPSVLILFDHSRCYIRRRQNHPHRQSQSPPQRSEVADGGGKVLILLDLAVYRCLWR
jgi:hypothetical protein